MTTRTTQRITIAATKTVSAVAPPAASGVCRSRWHRRSRPSSWPAPGVTERRTTNAPRPQPRRDTSGATRVRPAPPRRNDADRAPQECDSTHATERSPAGVPDRRSSCGNASVSLGSRETPASDDTRASETRTRPRLLTPAKRKHPRARVTVVPRPRRSSRSRCLRASRLPVVHETGSDAALLVIVRWEIQIWWRWTRAASR
jgi:hypothetical protein